MFRYGFDHCAARRVYVPSGIECIIHKPYIISSNSFSKMYKQKSRWQKIKAGKSCKRREPRRPKDTTNFFLKCLGFITNTFTDIARSDDRDLHNDQFQC